LDSPREVKDNTQKLHMLKENRLEKLEERWKMLSKAKPDQRI